MSSIAKELVLADLEQEMRQSYLDYAMSVIIGRALPDARDGLKPVHRRILFSMSELGNDWNKPYKKSARIIGDVIGKYHPHGDTAIYDAVVRMAQDFSLRYPLVDGQGNFGSVDGDSAAAMRYTEVRLAKIAHQLLANIDNDTVDFVPNYDETELQPQVLPTRIPNLLVNGSDGIAVGMATKIPPHNLSEIISGCLALIDNEDISIQELMEHIPGPDFPTAGIINGQFGIIQAYRTGRGSIRMRARAEIVNEENRKGSFIIVSEIPFQVNKARLMEKIDDLVKHGKIDGINALRDESDKSGMRIVIGLKANTPAEVVLNNLYAQTPMESTFGINMVALSNNQPKTFKLKELLSEFIEHRREVTRRRLLFELRKWRERAHVLEGFAVALSNLDDVIDLIRRSSNRPEAKAGLMESVWKAKEVFDLLGGDVTKYQWEAVEPHHTGFTADGYKLSEVQANAILDLRLHRLTGMERQKIVEEFKQILEKIDYNIFLLGSPQDFMNLIKDELIEVREEFCTKDERRTEIIEEQVGLEHEDLIPREDMVVTISQEGYAKRHPVSGYSSQNRGGKGKAATKNKDDDFVQHMFVANTHDWLLFFTSHGKVFRKKVYQLDSYHSRTAKGRPIVNLLNLTENEKITAILPVGSDSSEQFIVMATRLGKVKKCKLQEVSRINAAGKRVIGLRKNDELVGVGMTGGDSDIILFSNAGRAARFSEKSIRSMGRTAAGVNGMRLQEEQQVISMMLVPADDEESIALVISSDGMGKRTYVKEFQCKGRAIRGVVTLPIKKRGKTEIVSALSVMEGDEVVMITDSGRLIRFETSSISIIGRAAAGVRLMSVDEDEKLVSAAVVAYNDSVGE